MTCGTCPLGLDPCYARAAGLSVVCAHVRRELAEVEAGATPTTDYRGLVRGRSAAPPSLVGMATGFARSAARHVAAGMPEASPEVREARLAVCRACPRYRPGSGTCGVCGCTLRLKAAWSLEECPEGRWPA